MREVAEQVGLTERAVQRIISELEATGYVAITRVGRRNEHAVNRETPLRSSVVDGRQAGWLFDLLERKSKPK
jgi:DNA-binding transcriptional regulator LsrR (DeoR family)